MDDRNAAEELNGTVLYGEPWELEDDEFYPKDLVGLEARLKADGRVLGKVVDMIEARNGCSRSASHSPWAMRPPHSCHS